MTLLGVSVSQVYADLSLVRNNDNVLQVAANIMGIPPAALAQVLDDALAEPDAEYTAQQEMMQERMMDGIAAAAEHLGMEASDLAMNMGRMRNDHGAMSAAVAESGLPEDVFIMVINQQLASRELEFDQPIDFSVADYISLNIGMFLLMFAIGSISFMFSCIFNLTKNSLALGAGIPIAFLIFEIMSQSSDDLEFLRFLSLNTLFDPSAITRGGTFLPQFIVMAVVGSIMYLIGIKVFKEKDLPL